MDFSEVRRKFTNLKFQEIRTTFSSLVSVFWFCPIYFSINISLQELQNIFSCVFQFNLLQYKS